MNASRCTLLKPCLLRAQSLVIPRGRGVSKAAGSRSVESSQ